MLAPAVAATSARIHRVGVHFVLADGVEHSSEPSAEVLSDVLCSTADVPLLYESGSEGAFDAVAVVRCPPAAQRERVLARPGMSTEKFEGLLARQLPAEEKAARADFVIDTGRAPRATRGEVEALVRRLRGGGPGGAGAGAGGGAGAPRGRGSPGGGGGGS